MSRLVDEFILMLLFTALSFLLVFYLSQNVRYGSARTYYREAVYQLQKSDYSEEAKKQSDRAKELANHPPKVVPTSWKALQ